MRKIHLTGLLLVLALTLGMIACNSSDNAGSKSDLLNLKVDSKNIRDIVNRLRTDTLVSFFDVNNFHYGLLNLGDSVIGKSVKEIMAYGEKSMKEERLKELDNIAGALIMKSAIDISITNFEEIKDSNMYRVYVEFANKSDSPIKTNSGKLRFLSQDGRYFMIPVENMPLNIGPNQKTSSYFDLKDSLKLRVDILSNGNYKNLKSIDWLNTKMEFADGRQISVLQNTANTPGN